MEKNLSAAKIIQMYKLKKSAAVAGSVVISTLAVDSLISKKTNRLLAFGIEILVGTAAAVLAEHVVDGSYAAMNEFSIKSREKKKEHEDKCPEEYIEFDIDDEDEEDEEEQESEDSE